MKPMKMNSIQFTCSTDLGRQYFGYTSARAGHAKTGRGAKAGPERVAKPCSNSGMTSDAN